ncbi:MAG: hypothetical protein HQL59_08445 [Magnetococcales bacterium]|nr:hypothetical protein [Magnetococcales bacterium]
MENYKRELVFIFFAQRRKIVSLTLFLLMVSVAVSFLWPPSYQASGTILVKGKKMEKNLEALEDAQLRPMPVTKEDLFSELAIFASDEVMRRAIDELGKSANKEIVARLGPNPVKRMKKLQKSIESSVVPTSNVIQIVYVSWDPEVARLTLQTVMEQYIIYRNEVYNPVEASAFLSGQVGKYSGDLDSKTQEMIAHIEKTGATAADKQIEYNLLIKKDLEDRIAQLTADVVDRELTIRNLDLRLKQEKVQFFTFIANPGILSLGTKLQERVAEKEALLRRFVPDHPEIVRLEEQIRRSYDSLRAEVQSYRDDLATQLEVMREKIRTLQGKAASLAAENMALRKAALVIQRMERDSQLLEYSYQTFYKRNEEVRTDTSTNSARMSSYVTILAPAMALESPIFPNPRLLIPFGLVAGIMLGLSVGFLYEFFDQTFKRPEDVASHLELPLIFSIPEILSGEEESVGNSPVKGVPAARKRVLANAWAMAALSWILTLSLLLRPTLGGELAAGWAWVKNRGEESLPALTRLLPEGSFPDFINLALANGSGVQPVSLPGGAGVPGSPFPREEGIPLSPRSPEESGSAGSGDAPPPAPAMRDPEGPGTAAEAATTPEPPPPAEPMTVTEPESPAKPIAATGPGSKAGPAPTPATPPVVITNTAVGEAGDPEATMGKPGEPLTGFAVQLVASGALESALEAATAFRERGIEAFVVRRRDGNQKYPFSVVFGWSQDEERAKAEAKAYRIREKSFAYSIDLNGSSPEGEWEPRPQAQGGTPSGSATTPPAEETRQIIDLVVEEAIASAANQPR